MDVFDQPTETAAVALLALHEETFTRTAGRHDAREPASCRGNSQVPGIDTVGHGVRERVRVRRAESTLHVGLVAHKPTQGSPDHDATNEQGQEDDDSCRRSWLLLQFESPSQWRRADVHLPPEPAVSGVAVAGPPVPRWGSRGPDCPASNQQRGSVATHGLQRLSGNLVLLVGGYDENGDVGAVRGNHGGTADRALVSGWVELDAQP